MPDTTPDLILIAAMGANRVIGAGDGMPWNVPDEYAQFLRFIEGETVLMGRRSYEIFGDDLTSAHNLVVSRSVQTMPGAQVFSSVEAALEVARTLGRTIFSAGGATLYRQTLPLADKLYLSTIHGTFSGDTYFPEVDPKTWTVGEARAHPDFTFRVYVRR